MQSCKYFGQTGNVAKLVKDTCPPPLQRGAYYFTLDLDAGQSSEVVLQQAQLLSPADAMCDPESGVCTASTGPGYDLYVAKVRFQKDLSHILATQPRDSRGQNKQPMQVLYVANLIRIYLRVLKDCIPGPGAHGLRVPKSLPNEGNV